MREKTTRPTGPARLVFRDSQRLESGIASVRFGGDVFQLSIGEVTVVLDRRRAQDVVGVLTCALLATLPVGPPDRPARTRRGPRSRRPRSR